MIESQYTRFIVAFLATSIGLSVVGYLLAILFLPKPLTYYHTSYLEFAIPSDWNCRLESAIYQCTSLSAKKRSINALITVSAKETGKEDSMAIYLNHLETPKKYPKSDGTMFTSTVERVEEKIVSGRPWIVASHLGSEVPNYRTFYFATVAGNLSVLLSFSAHKDYSEVYQDDIFNVLETLKLFKDSSVQQL